MAKARLARHMLSDVLMLAKSNLDLSLTAFVLTLRLWEERADFEMFACKNTDSNTWCLIQIHIAL